MYDVDELDYPIESTRSIITPYGEQDENGTDLSLIRSLLQLTPAERLLASDVARRSALELMEYGRCPQPEKPAAADRRAV